MAEAIAAKAIIGESSNTKMLLQAMQLAPRDPRFPYLVARTKIKRALDSDVVDASAARPFLEHALKLDPNYLPALYAYAMMKPTSAQRVAALKRVAAIDAGNAEPYFLMAIETWRSISKDRKAAPGGDGSAYDVTVAEWKQVSDLLQKCSESPYFRWRRIEPPSARDIVICMSGKLWPRPAVDSLPSLFQETACFDGFDSELYIPYAFVSSAHVRQFALQARWAAKLAVKQGDTASAVEMLDVNRRFAYTYACHQPYRLITLLTAHAIRDNAIDDQIRLMTSQGNDVRAHELINGSARWRRAIKGCKLVMNQSSVTVDSVKISPKEKLVYTDYAREEAGMKKLLDEIGPPQ